MANADFRPSGTTQVSRVTTTDNSPTLAQTVLVQSDGVFLLDVEILSSRQSGASGSPGDSACYTRTLRVKRVGGLVTTAPSQTDYTKQDQKTWGVDISAGTGTVVVNVHGANGNTINWTITSKLRIQL